LQQQLLLCLSECADILNFKVARRQQEHQAELDALEEAAAEVVNVKVNKKTK
jgi:hypothetical protein